MRSFWIAAVVVLAAAGGWIGRTAFGEDEPGSAPAAPAAETDMEAEMTRLATPGPMHEWLAQAVGEWDMVTSSMTPAGTMEESKASASIKMVLGGRFQQQTIKGSFHGKPYEGHGLTGYDNLSEAFQNYWFDTMGTAPSVAKGKRSEDGKTLEMSGAWPMPGDQEMPFRMVTTIVDADHMTFAMYGEWEGQEMTMFTASYTRKK